MFQVKAKKKNESDKDFRKSSNNLACLTSRDHQC